MFRYGRSIKRAPPLVAGLALMAFPYFVSHIAATLAITLAIFGMTWAAMRYTA